MRIPKVGTRVIHFSVVIILFLLLGCTSDDDIKKLCKASFQLGVCYTIDVQDKEKLRYSKCDTYGDVADIAWERYMLNEGMRILKKLKS